MPSKTTRPQPQARQAARPAPKETSSRTTRTQTSRPSVRHVAVLGYN